MAIARARHILVATEQECKDLKAQIEQGADFVELAKKHCRTKPDCIDCPLSELCKKRIK